MNFIIMLWKCDDTISDKRKVQKRRTKWQSHCSTNWLEWSRVCHQMPKSLLHKWVRVYHQRIKHNSCSKNWSGCTTNESNSKATTIVRVYHQRTKWQSLLQKLVRVCISHKRTNSGKDAAPQIVRVCYQRTKWQSYLVPTKWSPKNQMKVTVLVIRMTTKESNGKVTAPQIDQAPGSGPTNKESNAWQSPCSTNLSGYATIGLFLPIIFYLLHKLVKVGPSYFFYHFVFAFGNRDMYTENVAK